MGQHKKKKNYIKFKTHAAIVVFFYLFKGNKTRKAISHITENSGNCFLKNCCSYHSFPDLLTNKKITFFPLTYFMFYSFTSPALPVNCQTQAVSCIINDTINFVIHQTHLTAAHLLNKHISDLLSKFKQQN